MNRKNKEHLSESIRKSKKTDNEKDLPITLLEHNYKPHKKCNNKELKIGTDERKKNDKRNR